MVHISLPLLEIGNCLFHQFNMAFTSFVCFLVIFFIVHAKGRNDFNCPKSLSCGNLTNLSFPFSLSTQPECGLMSISGCDAKPFPRIQLLPGGDWYYASAKQYYSVWLVEPKLQTTLSHQDECQAFNTNISLPNSPSISFNPLTLHNFYKCNITNNTPSFALKMKDHFAGYEKCDACDGFIIYYKRQGDDDKNILAGNLTANCSLIRLPIDSILSGDLFKLLISQFLVEWKLSDDCNQCHYDGGQCQTDKTNKFHCHIDEGKILTFTSIATSYGGACERLVCRFAVRLSPPTSSRNFRPSDTVGFSSALYLQI